MDHPAGAEPYASPVAPRDGCASVAPLPASANALLSPRVYWVECLLLALLSSLFVFRSFLPAWQALNTDFRNYYVTARLYREGVSLLRVYDSAWFQRQKDHLGMQQFPVTFVPHTLPSALPILPLAGLSPLTAKRCWLLVNAAFLALSALLLTRMTQLGWRIVLIVILLAIEPLSESFLFGQMHLLVFLLLLSAVWCSERCRPVLAGTLVALAAALKLYPALFLVFFVRKKQWRVLVGMLAGLLAMAGLSIYLFGWDVHRIYAWEILPPMGRGEYIDPYAREWNSLTQLLHSAFIAEPELNPHPLINAPALYALVQPLCQAAIFLPAVWLLVPGAVPRPQARLEWATFIAMLMGLSTGPLAYHLCILILAAALAFDSLLALGRRREACAVLALYGIVCFPRTKLASQNADSWHVFLASPRIFPLLALPFFLYRVSYSFPLVRARLQMHRQEARAFGAVFLGLSALGAVQALHHGRNQFDNFRRRLLTSPSAPSGRDPVVGANGLYCTKTDGQSPGFETWHWSGGQLAPLPPAEDEFHPTSAPALVDVWVELAGPLSNIVRFSNSIGAGIPRAHVEVENGEQPSVSPDGKWLTFIREIHGRGELWIKALAQEVELAGGEERKIVDDSYDVWEAAIEPGNRRILFTAAPDGRPGIHSLEIVCGQRLPKLIVAEARYPAFSPDDRWIAFSRLAKGAWQLWMMDLASGSTRRLTWDDCNSTSPTWEPGSKSLVYATDCARGLGMTALARVDISTQEARSGPANASRHAE